MSRSRWDHKIDLAQGGKFIVFHALYLIVLQITKAPYTITVQYGQEIILSNHLYIYYQYIEAIICVFAVMWIFEETFKPKSQEFILAFPINKTKIVLARYLWFVIEFEVPLCLGLVSASIKLNSNIIIYPAQSDMAATVIPKISPLSLIFQCLTVVNFFSIFSLFLLWIFRDKTIPLVLILAYCALEYGPMSRILGSYCLFRGAFNLPDYYHFFTPNVMVLLPIEAIMFTIVFRYFGKKSYHFTSKKGNETIIM